MPATCRVYVFPLVFPKIETGPENEFVALPSVTVMFPLPATDKEVAPEEESTMAPLRTNPPADDPEPWRNSVLAPTPEAVKAFEKV